MLQRALTVIAKVSPGSDKALETVLDTIGQDIRGKHANTYLRLEDITTLHFGRFVLIPNEETGGYDYLMFESNHDGTLREHTDEFADKAGEAMDLIWGKCEGYPTNRTSNPERYKHDFYRFIVRNSVDTEAYYIGYRGETVARLKWYSEFHDAIQNFLDLRDVEGYIAHRLKPLLAKMPSRPTQTERFVFLKPIREKITALIGRGVFYLDLAGRLLYTFILRPVRNFIWRREPALNLKLTDQTIQPGITDIEDVVTQNQLTVISAIKPETLRQLKVTLNGLHLVAKYTYNKGSLGTIQTIHFARWAIIDKGRYLAFFSNYDGSWDSYIGDFVDKAAKGMDAIWQSAPGYPEQGSIDIDAFKSIIRRNQVRTQVFYSAYPTRTIINILNDRAVARPFYREDVTEWMKHL